MTNTRPGASLHPSNKVVTKGNNTANIKLPDSFTACHTRFWAPVGRTSVHTRWRRSSFPHGQVPPCVQCTQCAHMPDYDGRITEEGGWANVAQAVCSHLWRKIRNGWNVNKRQYTTEKKMWHGLTPSSSSKTLGWEGVIWKNLFSEPK